MAHGDGGGADGLLSRALARRTDPVFWTEVTQTLKTVVAAVVAWYLARSVLGIPQSFLAPWAALLVVHATVYRTFERGARQVVGAVAGVFLAWAVGSVLGVDSASVAAVLVLGLAVGALPWFGEESTVAATTALVVLTSGFSTDDTMLLSRLADTGVGVGVGLVVNLVVWPPLRRRSAISKMDAIDDELGALLLEMADGILARPSPDDVEAWVDRTRELDDDLDSAWSLVRQARESARLNPRRQAAGLRNPEEWHRLLRRLEQGVAEVRSMARTVALDVEADENWDDFFRQRWVELLRAAGQAVVDARPEGLEEVRERLTALSEDLADARPDPSLWPVYGALMVNLRNIVDASHLVAQANPLKQPPLPHQAVRIPPVGRFSKNAPRNGGNPRLGEPVTVDPSAAHAPDAPDAPTRTP